MSSQIEILNSLENNSEDEIIVPKNQEEIAFPLNNYNDEENNSVENNNSSSESKDEEIDKKSRLLKRSEKIKKDKSKKLIKKFKKDEFVEEEAQLGSDNEEHDDVVKDVRDHDLSDELNEDLPDLIDKDAVEEKSDKQTKKFYNDMMEKDRAEIKQVIKGPVQRQKRLRSQLDKIDGIEDDYLALHQRIKKYQSMNSESEAYENRVFGRFLSMKNLRDKLDIQEEEEEDEDFKRMRTEHDNKMIKMISENSVKFDELIKKRNLENDKILENVIIHNNKDAKNEPKIKIPNRALPFNFNNKIINNNNSVLFRNKEDKVSVNEAPAKPFSFMSNNTMQNKSIVADYNSTSIVSNQPKSNLTSLFRKGIHEQAKSVKNNNNASSGKKNLKKSNNLSNFTNSLLKC